MSDIIRLTVILFVISALAALAIAATYMVTAPKIELQKQLEQNVALKEVFQEGTTIDEHKGVASIPGKYWTAKKSDGIIIGYAFTVSKHGYSSDINSIVGLDTAGIITGIKILSQSETPGLGTRVSESVSTAYLWNSLFKKRDKNTPWFQQQFRGLTVYKPIKIKTKCAEWHKQSDIERQHLTDENAVTAITGATISTTAVVTSIEKQASEYLKSVAVKSDTSAGR